MNPTSSSVRFPGFRRHPELIPAITNSSRQAVPLRRVNIARLPRSTTSLVVPPPNRLSLGSPAPTSPIITCSICLLDVRPRMGIPLSALSCGHKFCTSCIKMWLVRKNDCPCCRKVTGVSGIRSLYF